MTKRQAVCDGRSRVRAGPLGRPRFFYFHFPTFESPLGRRGRQPLQQKSEKPSSPVRRRELAGNATQQKVHGRPTASLWDLLLGIAVFDRLLVAAYSCVCVPAERRHGYSTRCCGCRPPRALVRHVLYAFGALNCVFLAYSSGYTHTTLDQQSSSPSPLFFSNATTQQPNRQEGGGVCFLSLSQKRVGAQEGVMRCGQILSTP